MGKRQCRSGYVFGPVPSRRLGFSLGIDCVPFKTCSYDCIYCQLGRTTDKSVTRKEFSPVSGILDELSSKLSTGMRIDYITLSGSGEPTLYLCLDRLVCGIKRLTGKPVAVLTNGSLLWDPDVRKGLNRADLVIPSLDAGNGEMFRYVNRPHESLSFERVVEGIIDFSRGFPNTIWLEVFLIRDATAVAPEVRDINSIVKRIRPRKVQLNTVNRPPAESFAHPVPKELMKRLAASIDFDVEIIADFKRHAYSSYFSGTKDAIYGLLKRRPCSLDDISDGLSMHRNEVLKYLDELEKNHDIVSYDHHHKVYYAVKKP
ncbi:MAG: radical SAM protein [Spirochaetales bacterium]|nr:radical SAM protein [Spirochaetales bacterium]